MLTPTNATDGRTVGPEPRPAVLAAQEWFDVGDLARRFKCSNRHVLRMANQGRLPRGIKFGNLRRWSRRQIEAWEAAQ